MLGTASPSVKGNVVWMKWKNHECVRSEEQIGCREQTEFFMSKFIAIIFGVLFMVLGIYELRGGLAGESRTQSGQKFDVPVAIMEPWQRVGTGTGVTLIGLYIIARQVGAFKKRI